ncbi:hypothetical protein BH23PLA1_BH23PLA1_10740 [soil metagenome]
MVNVNRGDNLTMLGQWRVVLKQAEESAKAGRLDDALALASRNDVADHRQAVQLRGRLVRDLVARAGRRAEADDLAGAIDDLDLAERHDAPPDVLASARLALADRVAEDLRVDLEAGEPLRVLQRAEHLAKHKVSGPALRRLREAAEAWQSALSESRRGEFGHAADQFDRADRLAGESARPALASARRDLEARQQAAHPKVERLYQTLATKSDNWIEVLAAAEAVLETVPDHPAARQARTHAWQQIGALSPSATLTTRSGPPGGLNATAATRPTEPPEVVFLDEPMAPGAALASTMGTPHHTSRRPLPASSRVDSRTSATSGPSGRCLLWADAIGGFLVCLDDRVVLGRAGPDSRADVPILGDLSRQHASLVRDGDGYLLIAHHPTYVNGRPAQTTPLRDGDILRLGSTVELEFRQPSPVSSTARLSILSRHRLPMAVDGVILMSQTCIVGPTRQCHISAPNLAQPVVLFRQGGTLWCRASGRFEIDGRSCQSRAPLSLRSSVLGEGFSFSLEPLGRSASSATA